MLDLYINVRNSLDALTKGLRVAIANANNFNTPGYKYSAASFTTVYNSVLSEGTDIMNPISIPGSVTLGSVNTDFSQGNLNFGTALDAAIVGGGFFITSRSATDFSAGSEKIYTRAGRFQIDNANQYITDSFGRKVFGFKVDANGNVQDSSLVPIQTGGNTDIGIIDGGLIVGNFQVRKDAIAAGSASPPEYVNLYRLALTTFQNKQGLIEEDGTSFRTTIASGEPISYELAGEQGMGLIVGERLESSNVNVAKVSMDMNLLNRGFSAFQGIVDNINKAYTQTLSKIG